MTTLLTGFLVIGLTSMAGYIIPSAACKWLNAREHRGLPVTFYHLILAYAVTGIFAGACLGLVSFVVFGD